MAKFWTCLILQFRNDDNFSKSIRLHLIHTTQPKKTQASKGSLIHTRNRPLYIQFKSKIFGYLVWIMWSHVIIALIWNNIYMRVNVIFPSADSIKIECQIYRVNEQKSNYCVIVKHLDRKRYFKTHNKWHRINYARFYSRTIWQRAVKKKKYLWLFGRRDT